MAAMKDKLKKARKSCGESYSSTSWSEMASRSRERGFYFNNINNTCRLRDWPKCPVLQYRRWPWNPEGRRRVMSLVVSDRGNYFRRCEFGVHPRVLRRDIFRYFCSLMLLIETLNLLVTRWGRGGGKSVRLVLPLGYTVLPCLVEQELLAPHY